VDLRAGDVVVVSQKIVSKAEGRTRTLAEVAVTEEAAALAGRLGKDPPVVQLALEESKRVIRAERGVLICETNDGWICANAGIDSSNVPAESAVTLLPLDSDASARKIRAEIHTAADVSPAVVVADSFGRPWRVGQCDVAIGCAGIEPTADWRGREDREGRELSATVVAVIDQIAAAADLSRDKAAGVPVAALRGLGELVTARDGPGAAALQRNAEDDLFR
jgi:coenzyme F420-0:L-glutamate ligase/coenzyme F420-1:gamma-L-glutamate ligase